MRTPKHVHCAYARPISWFNNHKSWCLGYAVLENKLHNSLGDQDISLSKIMRKVSSLFQSWKVLIVQWKYLPNIATDAPRVPNIKAIPFPSPVPPPVIKAVFPENVPFGSMGVFLIGKCFACGFVSSDIFLRMLA